MRIKGAIFDMDGTIIDSLSAWDNVGEEYLLERGKEPREGLRDEIKDMSLEQAAVYFMREYGIEGDVESIVDEVNKMMESRYFDSFGLKRGTLKMLDMLKNHGVRMCVATVTDIHMAEACIRRNGIIDYFTEIITCRQVGAPKDQPDIYLSAIERLGTERDETLIFEDALYAVRTAKNAGLKVAAVYDDNQKPDEDQIRHLADYYIQSYEDCESQFHTLPDGSLVI